MIVSRSLLCVLFGASLTAAQVEGFGYHPPKPPPSSSATTTTPEDKPHPTTGTVTTPVLTTSCPTVYRQDTVRIYGNVTVERTVTVTTTASIIDDGGLTTKPGTKSDEHEPTTNPQPSPSPTSTTCTHEFTRSYSYADAVASLQPKTHWTIRGNGNRVGEKEHTEEGICADECLANDRCVYFAFRARDGYCLLLGDKEPQCQVKNESWTTGKIFRD